MNNSLYDAYAHLQVVRDRAKHNADELDRLLAENERLREALGLLDEQLDSHGFSVDGPMRRLISRTLAAIQDKGGE